MIILLHVLHIFRYSLFRTIKDFYLRRMSCHTEEVSCSTSESEVMLMPKASFCENGVKFSPPAYIQRYGDVCDILKNDSRWAGQIHKVVDFGCAEMSFFMYLKPISELNSLLEVDYDGSLLTRFRSRIEPLFYDHLFQRTSPLKVSVLQGSVCDPDYRLIGCDVVICIELIEHLNPAAFDRLPHNIFGFIQPRLAIFTTPNADFNVLFPNLKDGGFRHYDHKFEWTREEFNDWAMNVTSRYPDYTVEMAGVAPGPEGTYDLGCCSQMAIFINGNYTKRSDINPEAVEKDFTEGVNPVTDWTYQNSVEMLDEVNIAQNISLGQGNCDKLVDPSQVPRSVDCISNPDCDISCSSDGLDSVDTEDDTIVLKMKDCHMNEAPLEEKKKPDENNAQQLSWDCRVWENDCVGKYYKTVAEHDYPFKIDNRTREQKVLEEVIYRMRMYSHYDDGIYNDSEDCWKYQLDYLMLFLGEFNIGIDELRSIVCNAGHEMVDDCLIYRKPCSLRSSTSSYCGDEDYTVNAHAVGDLPGTWEENWDEETEPWDVGIASNTFHTNSDHPAAQEVTSGECGDQTEVPNIESIQHNNVSEPIQDMSETIDSVTDQNAVSLSGQMEDSTISCPDDRSLSSPLMQFYGPNRDSADEQKLSDSGYMKSQDSPQSPICSDSFSNDLITPDKDFSEMVQSTILECIPENLNCLDSCSSPKDTSKNVESRRKSIGPMVTPDSSRNLEFASSSSMSRPKSLHVCTTTSEIENDFKAGSSKGGEKKNKSYSPIDIKDRSQKNTPRQSILLVQEDNIEPVHFDNIARHYNMPIRPQNNLEIRQPDYNAEERLARPDFLNIQNLERAVAVDHLNNNVDFEGNNFDDREREGEVLEEQGNNRNEDYNEDLLRQHLDRHNENHLVLGGPGIEELEEQGEIEEDVLEYRENFEGDENYGYNPRIPASDTILSYQNGCPSFISPSNSPKSTNLSMSPKLDENWETNYLLDSIERTLSLDSQEQFYNNPFPNTSDSYKWEESLPSTSKYNQMSHVRDGLFWETKYRNSNRYITRMIYSPNKFYFDNDSLLDNNGSLNMSDDIINEYILNKKNSSEESTNFEIEIDSEKFPNTSSNIKNKNISLLAHGSLVNLKSSVRKCNCNSLLDEPGTSQSNKSFCNSCLLMMKERKDNSSVEIENSEHGQDIDDGYLASISNLEEMSIQSSREISSYHSPESRISSFDYFSAEDELFPDWLLISLNSERIYEPDVVDRQSRVGNNVATDNEGRGGAGDGVGVHSFPSTPSSGHASMSSSTSTGREAEIDQVDQQTVSLDNLPILLSSVTATQHIEARSSINVNVNESEEMMDWEVPLLDSDTTVTPPRNSLVNTTDENFQQSLSTIKRERINILESDSSYNLQANNQSMMNFNENSSTLDISDENSEPSVSKTDNLRKKRRLNDYLSTTVDGENPQGSSLKNVTHEKSPRNLSSPANFMRTFTQNTDSLGANVVGRNLKIVEDDGVKKNNSLNSFSLHVLVSETSNNDADVDVDSDFDLE